MRGPEILIELTKLIILSSGVNDRTSSCMYSAHNVETRRINYYQHNVLHATNRRDVSMTKNQLENRGTWSPGDCHGEKRWRKLSFSPTLKSDGVRDHVS